MSDDILNIPPSTVRCWVECDALPGLSLTVDSMRIVEALTEPYKIDVALRPPEGGGDLPDVAAALGRDCTLRIVRHGRERCFRGLVREVHEGDDPERRAWARFVLVPALWMLTLSRDSRIFQNMSVVEILLLVLGPELLKYGRVLAFVPTRPYSRREYCVQYQESNFDFAHRLMEEEGIGYHFDHSGDRELLVLHDGNRALPAIDSVSPGVMPYEPHNLRSARFESIHEFELCRRPTIDEVAIRDFDWTQRSAVIDVRVPPLPLTLRPRHSYEHGSSRSLYVWEYASRRYTGHDGPLQAMLRLEAHSQTALVGTGVARAIGLSPGCRFQLVGHPVMGVDGEYVVTRAEHGARGTEHDEYENRFECIPYAQTYRPERRTPKPHIASIQTATVVGPPGEEIHTDEHGRVKLHFHWDRLQPEDDSSSCWVRVQQSWAGAGWGALFLPRVGMEAVVTFLDGDPDRPLVTGCVYNGANAPPYALPDEKTKSTVMSRSSPGGGGYNELRFEDRAGSEEIWLHGQKDWNTVIENDVTELTGRDRARTVRRDESVGVERDQSVIVGRDRTRAVSGRESVSVTGERSVDVRGDHRRSVGGRDELSVEGRRSVHVSESERHRVDGNLVASVGGHHVMKSGGHTWVRASKITLEADEEILLKVGDSFVRLVADKANVESFELFLNSGEAPPSSDAPVSPDEGGGQEGDSDAESEGGE